MGPTNLAACSCLLLVLVSGCAGDTSPTPPPTPVDSLDGATASTEPADVMAQTSTNPPDDTAGETAGDTDEDGTTTSGPPTLPPEAEEQTEAGADAFVRYYLEYFDYLRQNPDAGDLSQYAGPDCAACDAFESQIFSFTDNASHYEGSSLSITSSRTFSLGRQFSSEVVMREAPSKIIDDKGSLIRNTPPSDGVAALFTLEWVDGGWRVEVLQLSGQ